jgi:hypothetical protein
LTVTIEAAGVVEGAGISAFGTPAQPASKLAAASSVNEGVNDEKAARERA